MAEAQVKTVGNCDATESKEQGVEEEPQESPTPPLVIKPAISVAYGNSGNCSVQSAGIFCDAIINGDMSSTDSRGDYNLEKAEKAASVEEIEQQAEAAAEDTKIEQVETAAAPPSQADGNSSSPTGGRGEWGS